MKGSHGGLPLLCALPTLLGGSASQAAWTSLGPALYVGGIVRGTFDTYAASKRYNVPRTASGLCEAVQTAQKQAASPGTSVAVDRWVPV